jgi:oligopeptide/dipeptide ABC transporter ATP-binding protein
VNTHQVTLEIKDLSVAYLVGKYSGKAVENVSFDIKQGEIFGLAGESGCGKSTLAWSILMLLPKTAKVVSGQIVFEGQNLLQLSERVMDKEIRGTKISIIIQNVKDSLNPVFSIGSQMSDLIRFHQHQYSKIKPDTLTDSNAGIRKKSERKHRVINMLREMEIAAPQKRFYGYPHQFSGGMKQRVMLAMGLMSHPSLLVADEPTTGLDVSVERYVLDLFKAKINKYNTSVLYITHDLRVLSEIANRVAIMYAGRIVERAPAEELFSRPLHPYTIALLECLPEKGAFGEKLREIPGKVPSIFDREETCSFRPRCSIASDVCAKIPPPYLEVTPSHFVLCHNV